MTLKESAIAIQSKRRLYGPPLPTQENIDELVGDGGQTESCRQADHESAPAMLKARTLLEFLRVRFLTCHVRKECPGKGHDQFHRNQQR